MCDLWEQVCLSNKLLSQTPKNVIINPKDNYPTDLPEWYTENDDIVDPVFPDDLFFDPYKTIHQEMKELEEYETQIENVSDDEDEDSEEYSDYEWDTIKNKF